MGAGAAEGSAGGVAEVGFGVCEELVGFGAGDWELPLEGFGVCAGFVGGDEAEFVAFF